MQLHFRGVAILVLPRDATCRDSDDKHTLSSSLSLFTAARNRPPAAAPDPGYRGAQNEGGGDETR